VRWRVCRVLLRTNFFFFLGRSMNTTPMELRVVRPDGAGAATGGAGDRRPLDCTTAAAAARVSLRRTAMPPSSASLQRHVQKGVKHANSAAANQTEA
jgi:hypothetical protein